MSLKAVGTGSWCNTGQAVIFKSARKKCREWKKVLDNMKKVPKERTEKVLDNMKKVPKERQFLPLQDIWQEGC